MTKATRRRWPLRLDLLPGLRWSGRMTVRRLDDGRYRVDWDATSPSEWIGDRCVMTAEQIRDWTGVDVREVER